MQLSAKGSSEKYNATPSSFLMHAYDPNNGDLTSDYIFSRTGKTYIKPLNSIFYYVAAKDTGYTIHVTFGNMKNAL